MSPTRKKGKERRIQLTLVHKLRTQVGEIVLFRADGNLQRGGYENSYLTMDSLFYQLRVLTERLNLRRWTVLLMPICGCPVVVPTSPDSHTLAHSTNELDPKHHTSLVLWEVGVLHVRVQIHGHSVHIQLHACEVDPHKLPRIRRSTPLLEGPGLHVLQQKGRERKKLKLETRPRKAKHQFWRSPPPREETVPFFNPGYIVMISNCPMLFPPCGIFTEKASPRTTYLRKLSERIEGLSFSVIPTWSRLDSALHQASGVSLSECTEGLN